MISVKSIHTGYGLLYMIIGILRCGLPGADYTILQMSEVRSFLLPTASCTLARQDATRTADYVHNRDSSIPRFMR